MGWIFHTPPQAVPATIKDLERNKLIEWQHKHYHLLGPLMGFGLPTAVAGLWGDLFGGFLIAGALRLVLQYHATWTINSVAHAYGSQRYGKIGTARFARLLSPFNVGEHLHDRHHLAPTSAKFGTRWYHFDIGYWFINLCERLSLVWDVRISSEEEVTHRARRILPA